MRSTRLFRSVVVGTVSFFISSIWLGGCGDKPASRPAATIGEPSADDPHGLHNVNSARLTAIMDELAALDLKRLASEAQSGKPPYRDIEQVADCAGELAADALAIPRLYKDADMNEESRRVFEQQAATLQDESVKLGRAARRKDYATVQSQLARVIATCNSCHASFRGPKMAEGVEFRLRWNDGERGIAGDRGRSPRATRRGESRSTLDLPYGSTCPTALSRGRWRGAGVWAGDLRSVLCVFAAGGAAGGGGHGEGRAAVGAIGAVGPGASPCAPADRGDDEHDDRNCYGLQR